MGGEREGVKIMECSIFVRVMVRVRVEVRFRVRGRVRENYR